MRFLSRVCTEASKWRIIGALVTTMKALRLGNFIKRRGLFLVMVLEA
jgi:hypothetical protein